MSISGEGGGVGGQKKSGVVRRYQFETGSLNSYHTTFLKKSFHKCTVLPQNFIAIHLLRNIA